jgi:hypothetical protein
LNRASQKQAEEHRAKNRSNRLSHRDLPSQMTRLAVRLRKIGGTRRQPRASGSRRPMAGPVLRIWAGDFAFQEYGWSWVSGACVWLSIRSRRIAFGVHPVGAPFADWAGDRLGAEIPKCPKPDRPGRVR